MKELFELISIEVVYFTDEDVVCGPSSNQLPPIIIPTD